MGYNRMTIWIILLFAIFMLIALAVIMKRRGVAREESDRARLEEESSRKRAARWQEEQAHKKRAEQTRLKELARIMHHATHFLRSGELTRADVPSGGIGVRTLGVRRVWG
jgi:Flp pilus assembly protein TadB